MSDLVFCAVMLAFNMMFFVLGYKIGGAEHARRKEHGE